MTVVVKRHDLAVKNCRTFQFSQGPSDLWETFREVIMVTAVKPHFPFIIDFGYRSEAIPRPLKEPVDAVERIANEPRHHRGDHLFV